MDCYRGYCQQHPYEAQLNFCAQPDCLQALCATCICEHTQQHMKSGTTPIYENIKDTQVKYHLRLQAQVHKIEEDSHWLEEIKQRIQQQRAAVGDIIAQAKRDCLAMVDKHFAELESKIEHEINNQGKRHSLHGAYRLDTLSALLHKEHTSLLEHAQNLASQQLLSTIRRLQIDVLPASEDFHLRLSKQLKENQVYAASALYRKEFMPQLQSSLKSLIHLEFLLPRVELLRNPSPAKSSLMTRSNSALIMGSSNRQLLDLQPKYSQSLLLSTPPLHLSRMRVDKESKAKGLQMIRQSRRESCPNEDAVSMTSSQVSGKENDILAHSTYYDSGSNFYR